ncbi:MAG: Spo0E family sporulation regulatory protein-aspartic acid phosphatase [Clostridium sp.]|nr:Spo0E family sporulation regulatory protein-aspartic acid phosphatase [Clostridium sp.]
MNKIEKIRKELGALYLKEGLSYRVLELSKKLDKKLLKNSKRYHLVRQIH